MDIEELFHHLEDFERPYVSRQRNPFLVLIGGILSTRTKDEVTEKALKRLIEHAPDLKKLNEFPVEKIEELIYPVGFYHTKAKKLKMLTKTLLEKYKGKIPQKLDQLLSLPGVGRKVATLVLSAAFDKDEICVDTHVHRISNRLGLVKTKNVLETERELKKVIPQKHWKEINSCFVTLGKRFCHPKRPMCTYCPLKNTCHYRRRAASSAK
ncbi:MAG: endonuclease III [Deltaproteobacteria bacterium]|nr:endonuclease III [Deltaproteobacteria bacterium]